ncbi:polysaccharide deacetylase family protein [Pseudarthrobacter defluvii]|uniref:polysaccharide deacetylase family protein n=1 Tax=Pseudarthrobacter defluvii TaxID=410837 RepID=UPI0027D8C6C3|nr:polysaccharide deacetylase family protein [Pseudarthrobacter defluvii]
MDNLPGWNSHLDSWLLDTLDKAAASSGSRYSPRMALNAAMPAEDSLTVTAEPVLAGGTWIMFRERVTDTGPDRTRTVNSQTFTIDTVSGELRPAIELLRPEAVDRIRSRASSVPVAIAAPTAQHPAPADLVFTPSGELQISSPYATERGRTGGGGIATIPAGEAESMLSEAGRRMLSQLQTPAATRPLTPLGLRHINCDIVPCAALTYDDGPDTTTTAQLLTILKNTGAEATFFMTGSNAAAHPATARQVAEAGHAIGNHTYSHPYLTKLPPAGVKSEIDGADAAIRAAIGSSPSLMRPPYGAADATVQSAVGKPLILWAVDSLDWQSRNPALFVPKVLKEISPGDVVLMHDVDPTTIAGQQELITSLQGMGYRLVTVPQLFEGTPLAAGHVYRARPGRR